MTDPATDSDRAAGILLHPTSLPGRYGIGDMGDELIAFLDWVEDAGMTIWQVLPLTPPGYGNSPYGCLSSYAGNPLLISPDRLVRDGLLDDVGRVLNPSAAAKRPPVAADGLRTRPTSSSNPSRTRRSGEMSSGLPAYDDRHPYGELP